MKEQILAALKTKFSNLGFTDKTFDGVATFVAASVTDATQLETFVAGVEPLLKVFQSDADTRVNTALSKKATETKATEDVKTEVVVNTPTAGGSETEKAILATLATMTETIKGLGAKVEGIETGAATQTRQQRLETSLEKAPAIYKTLALELFNALKFDTEEQFNEFLTAKVSGVADFTKSTNEEALKNLPKPSIGIPGKDGKAASGFADMMKGVVETKLAAAADAK